MLFILLSVTPQNAAMWAYSVRECCSLVYATRMWRTQGNCFQAIPVCTTYVKR